MKRWKGWLELFAVFFRIGLFTFGGGYAMISLIEDEISARRGWIDSDELAEVVAIAESTPGPIAINCATYVGCMRGGIFGAVASTMGVVLPSLVIIFLISVFYDRFMAIHAFQSAFRGIQVAVGFLILRAGLRMIRRTPGSGFPVAVCAVGFGLMLAINLLRLPLSTFWLIAGAALAGLIASGLRINGRRLRHDPR